MTDLCRPRRQDLFQLGEFHGFDEVLREPGLSRLLLVGFLAVRMERQQLSSRRLLREPSIHRCSLATSLIAFSASVTGNRKESCSQEMKNPARDWRNPAGQMRSQRRDE